MYYLKSQQDQVTELVSMILPSNSYLYTRNESDKLLADMSVGLLFKAYEMPPAKDYPLEILKANPLKQNGPTDFLKMK